MQVKQHKTPRRTKAPKLSTTKTPKRRITTTTAKKSKRQQVQSLSKRFNSTLSPQEIIQNNQPVSSPQPKKICDPYGLDNQPLDINFVKMQLEFVLDNRWQYDEEKASLKRTYAFSKVYVPPLTSPLPGGVTGPKHGPGACFTFLKGVGHIGQNNDHYPYDVQVTPRKSEVEITLKTVGRRGVTHADFNLAVHIDAFYTQMAV